MGSTVTAAVTGSRAWPGLYMVSNALEPAAVSVAGTFLRVTTPFLAVRAPAGILRSATAMPGVLVTLPVARALAETSAISVPLVPFAVTLRLLNFRSRTPSWPVNRTDPLNCAAREALAASYVPWPLGKR